MQSLRYLPLCFLAGVDGLNMFAPYAAMVLASVPLIAWARRRRAALEDATPSAISAAA